MDTLLLLFFLTLLKYITAIKAGLFTSQGGFKVANVYKTVALTERSKTYCTQLCVIASQCISANFNNKTISCELSLYHPGHIASGLIAAEDWTMMYNTDKMKGSWTLVFRGTARIGIDVANSFVGTNAHSLPIPNPGCYSKESLECNTHVRSSLIDNWEALNINEVKMEMLKNGKTVAYVIFQNRATDDKTTWFSSENILNSSWTDLPSETSGYPHFQLERLSIADLSRSFNVYHKFVGCDIDEGWMFVSEVTGTKYCPYELHTDYPLFLYTMGSTAQVLASAYGIADVMMISIRG